MSTESGPATRTAADVPFTPTDDEMRYAYAGDLPSATAEFDRWLAEHDRGVAAQALWDAAEAINHRDAETIRREAGAEAVNRALDVIRWLRARAYRNTAGESA